MTERAFACSVAASLGAHLVALAAASVLVGLRAEMVAPAPVPIELMTLAPAPATAAAPAASISNEGAARPPESSTQWELGNKTTFLDGRISLTFALFHTTREDFLVSLGGDQIPIGTQRTQGFEVDLASEPVPGWRLYANYAFMDAELVRLSPSDPSTGKGHRPIGVPENAAGLWTTYELQAGPRRGLGFGGGVTFKDAIFIDTLNTLRIPSYLVGDLVAFYRRGPVEVQLNINHVANVRYLPVGLFGGARPGDPLSALASVQVRY